MSHPDYDFPCNRVFWETDDDYRIRRRAMNEKKAQLEVIEREVFNLRQVIEARDIEFIATIKYMNEIAQRCADAEWQMALKFKEMMNAMSLRDKRIYSQKTEQANRIRKILSELTR